MFADLGLPNAEHELLKAQLALQIYQIAYYNLSRIHQSLRVTPAMEAGVTDHV